MEEKVNYYDFSKMSIDLSKVSPGQSVFDIYPELSEIKAYQKSTQEELKVGIHTCEPHGPFSSIKRFEVRLETVFRFLQLDKENEHARLFDEVLHLKSDNVADVWTEYLSSVFYHEWTSWFSSSCMYYQMMEQLRKPIDFVNETAWTKRANIESKVDGIYKRMKAMEAVIFVDEEIKKKAFNKDRDKIENFPEKHADENSVI